MHLTLRNFGPITELDLEVKKVTVFVGEQGSGKSMVAKWLHFGATLSNDLGIVFFQAFSKATFEVGQIRTIIQDFLYKKFLLYWGRPTLWTGASGYFAISELISFAFKISEKRITFDIPNSIIDFVADGFRILEDGKQMVHPILTNEIVKSNFRYFDSAFFFPASRSSQEYSLLFGELSGRPSEIETFLYTPILPTGEKNYYSFLNKIDQLIVNRFNQYLINLREFFRDYNYHFDETHQAILKGIYHLDEDEDDEYIIRASDGKKISLSLAATGQKEVLRILQDLIYIKEGGDDINARVFRVYEEPEAHLWPNSIMTLMDLVYKAFKPGSYAVITTHSPIVCNTLNVQLAAGAKDIEVIYLKDGQGQSLIDPETNLIDLSTTFTEVDYRLIDRFEEAFEKQNR